MVMAWTERQPAGNADRYWEVAKCSRNGLVMIAGDSYRLYLSTDGGENWAETRPKGDFDGNYWAACLSDDGAVIVVGEYLGRLYLTTNTGSSWSEITPAGSANQYWCVAACDSDGSVILVGVRNGRLYLSTNSGASFSETRPQGDADNSWYDGACDGDGSFIIVSTLTAGQLFYTSNGGSSWTEAKPLGATIWSWKAVGCDLDGSFVVVGNSSGYLFTSSDGCAHWTERTPAGVADGQDWRAVKCDDTGAHVWASYDTGRLWTSPDGGANWTEERPAGDVDYSWERGLGCNSDSSIAIASICGGRLYTGGPGTPPLKAINPTPGDDATDVVITTSCTWENGGGATSYDVYWGTTSGALTRVSPGQAGLSYNPPGNLESSRTYYWRIDSINAYGTTTGDEWSFTTAEAAVTATEPYLGWVFPPAVPFAETLSWLTTILTSRDGSQQRIAHRAGVPVQGFTYPLVTWTEAETVRLQNQLHAWLKKQQVIPIWAEATLRTAPLAAGATTIALATANADYRVNSRALVWASPGQCEIVTTSGVAAGSLTLAAGLGNSYGGRHFVMPCRIGYATAPAKPYRYHAGAMITEVTYRVTDNILLAGYTAALTYDSLEVLTEAGKYLGDGWSESHDGNVIIVDAGTGAMELASLSDFNVVTQDHAWCHDSMAKAWQFRLWLHSIVGRQKSFLVPSGRPDFVLTRACSATDTSVYVANRGFADPMGVNALETYLAFRPAGATIIPRKILNMAPIDANEERIDLAAAPGRAFLPGDNLCWVRQCCLGSDMIRMDWQEIGVNLVEAQLRRVEQ